MKINTLKTIFVYLRLGMLRWKSYEVKYKDASITRFYMGNRQACDNLVIITEISLQIESHII